MELGKGGWADDRLTAAIGGGLDMALDILEPDERVFRVQVQTPLLHEALVGVGQRGGWRQVASGGPQVCCVTDVPVASGIGQVAPPQILVVEPTPAAASQAAACIGAGVVSGAILSSQPALLIAALCMVAHGWLAAPTSVMQLAGAMPELSERQIAVMQAVVAGQRNSEIAAGLCLSTASIKREIAILFEAVGVSDRFALARFAADLGLTPRLARL